MHKLYIFPEKNMCAYPNLHVPKIFRPVTRNTVVFLFGLCLHVQLSSSACSLMFGSIE